MTENKKISRKDFLKKGSKTAATITLGGLCGYVWLKHAIPRGTTWQIDPAKCVQCGNCATHCVLAQSAVKCVHAFDVCGYCNLCGGYFPPDALELNTGAENQLCPTSALKRTFVEDPYFEYSIDEDDCIGCGKCVKGCTAFGNGSLYLQIRQNLCSNCNECAIARSCPADAISRVSASEPYLLKGSPKRS